LPGGTCLTHCEFSFEKIAIELLTKIYLSIKYGHISWQFFIIFMVVAGNPQLWERLPAAISPFMSCIQSRLEAAPTRQFRQTHFTDELFYQNT